MSVGVVDGMPFQHNPSVLAEVSWMDGNTEVSLMSSSAYETQCCDSPHNELAYSRVASRRGVDISTIKNVAELGLDWAQKLLKK